MKKLFLKLLAFYSRWILRKYKPMVIGITGSIGKTSAKEAILAVVSQKLSARGSIRNYNNEFGLPFTVIGMESPKRNFFKWMVVFAKAKSLILLKHKYPQALVLEMGIDRPGDMDKLLEIMQPKIAVLTTIGISHLQNFANEDEILREKSKIFSRQTAEDFAILNFDDARVRSLENKLSSKVISYGLAADAQVKILNYNSAGSSGSYGTEAELEIGGIKEKIFLSGSLGLPAVSASVAAAAVGLALGMNANEIRAGLLNFHAQTGRMQILPGKEGSILIDDTYNAAPLSMQTALEELVKFNPKDFSVVKRIAILGDMLELGGQSEDAHREIGEFVRKLKIDIFIGVGERMKLAKPDFWFPDSVSAIEKSREYSQKGMIILVKGSRGMAMEKTFKAL